MPDIVSSSLVSHFHAKHDLQARASTVTIPNTNRLSVFIEKGNIVVKDTFDVLNSLYDQSDFEIVCLM